MENWLTGMEGSHMLFDSCLFVVPLGWVKEDEGDDDDDIHSFRFIIICKLLTLEEVEEGLLLFAMEWTTDSLLWKGATE